MGSGCTKGEREQPERKRERADADQEQSASYRSHQRVSTDVVAQKTSGQSGSKPRSSGPERKSASGELSSQTEAQQSTTAVSKVHVDMAESTNPSTVIVVMGASVRANIFFCNLFFPPTHLSWLAQ